MTDANLNYSGTSSGTKLLVSISNMKVRQKCFLTYHSCEDYGITKYEKKDNLLIPSNVMIKTKYLFWTYLSQISIK